MIPRGKDFFFMLMQNSFFYYPEKKKKNPNIVGLWKCLKEYIQNIEMYL